MRAGTAERAASTLARLTSSQDSEPWSRTPRASHFSGTVTTGAAATGAGAAGAGAGAAGAAATGAGAVCVFATGWVAAGAVTWTAVPTSATSSVLGAGSVSTAAGASLRLATISRIESSPSKGTKPALQVDVSISDTRPASVGAPTLASVPLPVSPMAPL